MFERLGSWTYRFRFLIVVAWIVASVLMAAFAPSLAGTGSSDQTTFLPPGTPSRAAHDALERAFPGSTSTSSATITLFRAGGLSDTDRQFRDDFAAWTTSDQAPSELRAAVSGTETADSRPELESLLRSADGGFEMVIVNLNVDDAGDEGAAVIRQLREHLQATTPTGLETHVTGAAAISSDYLDAIKAGTESTTLVTVVLVIVVLLLIYRAPLAALIPLVTIGGAYMVARGVLGFMAAAGFQISSLLDTFLVVLVFGVGTDYAIFLISRYREEVGGVDWHDAARVTVRRIGAVITASAATVIVGLLAMGVGDFQMITTIGVGLALAVAMTLLANLTLTPALLSIFGHYLFWPLHTMDHKTAPSGFFAWLSTAVSKRPALVTVGLLVLLLVPVLYIPKVEPNFDVLADLPAAADSRLGYEAIGDNLGEDKLVQSTALITTGGNDVLAPTSLAKLHGVMVALHETGGIATTTSIVTPDGDTTIPDGFRPSKTLQEIADGFTEDDTGGSDTGALLDDEVTDGLNQALDYVNGLAVAFPDVGARAETRAVRGSLEKALDMVNDAREQAVLSTQLRTLASSITDPANVTAGNDSDSTLLTDYLAELATAYPEVNSLQAYDDAVAAAAELADEASITAALDLADALDRLADHFADRPDATFVPTSLSDTASAKEGRQEAERLFDDLPDQFAALGAVYAARPDDVWIPTTVGGEEGADLQDAIDAFVSGDRTATRFYVTSSSDPYSGNAFSTVKHARTILAAEAQTFGPSAAGHISGPTAQFADVQDTLAADFQKVGVITIVGILIVLMLLLRSIVAPLYLVGTVLVSYGSAIGISAFLFQEVLGQPGTSPYLPLILFVLLVALGADYNIFLMHRVREEAEHRSIHEGVRIASARTGAVITSAGIVLAGTFGSMVTSPVIILFQMGVAVAIGVLIDTFLVRSILVPAITTLVGDRAWWPSGASVAALLGRLAGPRGVAPVPVGATPGVGAPALALDDAALAATGPRSRTRLAFGIALAVLVPAMVVGLLTWSFGAASANLASVRAAVVNLDEGGSLSTPDGSTEDLALGTDLTTALLDGGDDSFTWVASDEASAAAGLNSGDYAAVLTIPADFSRSVAAIRSDPNGIAPRATLKVATDDGSGYTVGNVARAVTAAIGTATAQGITASYVDDVLVQVTTARNALAAGASDAEALADDGSALADDVSGTGAVAETVSSGLRQLADEASGAVDGTRQLVDGLDQMADGTDRLASGAVDLADGAGAAADGARDISSGASELARGLRTLKSQTADLPSQARRLADGVSALATGTTGVADGAGQLADGLDEMATQTNGMGDGAVALNDGAAALEQGARDLRDGASATAAGAGDLASGAANLADGIDAYTQGVDGLAANCAMLGGSDMLCGQLAALSDGSAQLRGGAAGVKSGASQLSAGVDGLADGMDGIVTGASGVHDGTSALAQNLPQLESGIDASAAGAGDLAAGAAELATGARRLDSGTQQLADGMPDLTDGIALLSEGAGELAAGLRTYSSGIADLADGTDTFAEAARTAASGAAELADGASSSADGMGQLTDAVDSAADGAALVEEQVNNLADDGDSFADRAGSLAAGLDQTASGLIGYDEETRTRIGDLAADPLAVDSTRVSATSAEAGLAPYFMGLAAWLGALGAFLVVPALAARDDRRWWLSAGRSYASAATIATVGALLTVPALGLLGVPIADVGALLGFAVLAALSFTAVLQPLVALFGTRGWFVGLLLLVLGIAASGLVVSEAAVPDLLAAIRPLLPLTYAIDAFRQAITGGGGSLVIDALALTAFLIVGILVTLTAAASRGQPTRARAHRMAA